ncbi:MAG: TlpA family protein disulfide reductase [Planctomycetota bacterium]
MSCFRFALLLLLVASLLPAPAARALQPAAAEAEAPAEAGLTVPELPANASPEELLEFVGGLMPPKQRPRSREEMFAYIKGVSQVAVTAADKVLAQTKADDELHAQAAKLKLESLSALGRLGDEQAAADMAAFAATLATSPVKSLAMEAKRMLVVAEAQKMFSTGEFGNAAAVVQQTADLLKADPDDQQTAGLAMQLAGALEQIPGGGDVAVGAMKSFGAIFETSGDERIRGLAKAFEGKLRFLSLPGKPMEITGTLLDGQKFDPASLAGKVVLVDFWATWCGPCVAEIPNMLTEYEKYHDKGFEIVGISLDQDREALMNFVTERKIPWPVLHEQEGEGSHPLAEFYGINGIPQFVLIGRDGNVITLDVRGEKLGERLAELFKDAG